MFVDPTALNAGEASAKGEAAELSSWAKIVAQTTGLKVRPSRCKNDIVIRIGSVQQMFKRRIGNRAACKIDRKNCPELIKGCARDYKFEKTAVMTAAGVEYREKPTKNFASHVCNALEYGAANAGEQDMLTGKDERRAELARARAQQARQSQGRSSDPLAAYGGRR